MKAQTQIFPHAALIGKTNFSSSLNPVKQYLFLFLFSIWPIAPSLAQCNDWIDMSANGGTQTGLTVDDEGNIYYGGQFSDSVTIGNQLITANTNFGSASVFIAKVDPNGNLLWERHFTNTGNDNGIFNPELAWRDGKLYVSGVFFGSLVDESGQTVMVNPGYFSFYVIRLLDADGQISTYKSFATNNASFSSYTGLYGITVGVTEKPL